MNLALFDFDGPITVKDTFVPFVRFAMQPRRMPIALGLAHRKYYRWTEVGS